MFVPTDDAAIVDEVRLFEAAGQEGLARALVINKIGAENVDLPALLAVIKETFGGSCLPLTLPGNGGKDVVNVLAAGAKGDTDLGDVDEARIFTFDANHFLTSDLQMVPEPSTFSLLGLAILGGLTALRRRLAAKV